jgi:hypothetical protein
MGDAHISEAVEFKEGDHDEFIAYLFGADPRPPNTVVLESPSVDPAKHINLHIFEQLLMIFVDGLKFFYGNREGRVDVNELGTRDIARMNRYFHSLNYSVHVDLFETVHDYQFRYPNYFKNQETITSALTLSDLYYEIFGYNNRVFRISFEYGVST